LPLVAVPRERGEPPLPRRTGIALRGARAGPEAMAVKIAPARISSLGCAESTAAISRSLRTGVSGTS